MQRNIFYFGRGGKKRNMGYYDRIKCATEKENRELLQLT